MSNPYRTFSFAGLSALRTSHLAQLQKIELDSHALLLDLAVRHGASKENAKAQIGQDVFVLYALHWKRNGFFVEFGATNGFDLSNTYLLEKDFGWCGILAEPATIWRRDLTQNRTAAIETDCVWSATGAELEFVVAQEPELSTLSPFKASDYHSKARRDGQIETVTTVSLEDLLARHAAPQEIDYLSVDTEGSEFEILSNFDFSKYEINVITCEHNFSPERRKIYDLLTRNGYSRVLDGLSRWDDWYVKSK